MKILAGIDLGGTKCAVTLGRMENGSLTVSEKQVFATGRQMPPEKVLHTARAILHSFRERPEAIGISCGGPLDSEKGLICCPPNLPLWKDIPITSILSEHFHVPVRLQNDANACALAEWKFGAGQGAEHMIFLTFGTGLGAGIILNGRLYGGANGNAGEVGHIRLAGYGPSGYAKAGSFEGFCSGTGIAQLGYTLGLEACQRGVTPSYFGSDPLSGCNARSIADAAAAGDETARHVYELCGDYLGRGLSVLIDILNPQVIVIGSIFARAQELLQSSMRKAIEEEALAVSAGCCRVVPAMLGEQLGDYAALTTAIYE